MRILTLNQGRLVAAGAGLASAFLLSTLVGNPMGGAFSGLALLFYFAPLPLFFAGLAYGVSGAAIAGATATAALALDGIAPALGYLAVFAVPVVAMVRWALLSRPADAQPPSGGDNDNRSELVEWFPAGQLVMRLCGLAVALLAAIMLATALTGENLDTYVQSLAAEIVKHFPAPELPDIAEDISSALVTFLPAMAAAGWIGLMAINGAMAQGLAKKLGQNLRPAPPLAEIRFPNWLAVAFLIAVALALASPSRGIVTVTLAAILAMPFLFQGIGVAHWLADFAPSRRFMLIGFYILLFAARILVFLVTFLGLIEQWAMLRLRFADQRAGRRGL
jgi:hypothetical protein